MPRSQVLLAEIGLQERSYGSEGMGGEGICKRKQESSSGEASHLFLVHITLRNGDEVIAFSSKEIHRQTLGPEGFQTQNTAIWEEGNLNPMCTH